MRTSNAGRALFLCGAAVLTACQDGVTAVRDDPSRHGANLIIGGCAAYQAERAVQSLGDGYSLPTVTVTASFPTQPLPWNVMQQMEFPLYSGASAAPCLNSPQTTYRVDTLYVPATAPVPVPEGVDPGFWMQLSPREQHVLLAKAEEMMRLYPNRFPSVSSVINNFFNARMLPIKTHAKLRANDFFGLDKDGELFAGGVYGCLLYQQFATDPDWFLPNDATLAFVIELVTAFAEAEFAASPLRALRFGANGTFGAAMSAADHGASECGRLIFDSIGDRIKVNDPYSEIRPTSPGTYSPSPTPPTTGSLPIGWMDQ